MAYLPGSEVDAWLRQGRLLITSSDRAARVLQADFHSQRRDEGLSAWMQPRILAWKTFVRSNWEERDCDGSLVLNAAQEQSIWYDIIRSEQVLSTSLPHSIRRLARAAMEADELLCSYAPHLLEARVRSGWERDPGAFSRWLTDFNQYLEQNRLTTLSRVPLDLLAALQKETAQRVPLRLAGFDRIVPTQKRLLDAWGSWQLTETEEPPARAQFHFARDGQAEIDACAFWCRERLAQDPQARLLVVTPDQAMRRGEIERAMLRFIPPGEPLFFEFSLGIPLSRNPYARSALLLLHWLEGSLSEHELDWLFASEHIASPEEAAALQAFMRSLRRRSLERPRWTLEAFLAQQPSGAPLPSSWVRRIQAAQRSLRENLRQQNPMDWAEKIPKLLALAGWPGSVLLESIDFQAERRWNQALETTGSLGFNGRRLNWPDTLAEIELAVESALFAPQSADAPVQIIGAAESAGLNGDAIWFLGADENSWPPVGSMHPFLPPHIQRQMQMPHNSPLDDWQFASTVTRRLMASAPEVHFSFSLQTEDVESRPSRLISGLADPPGPVPPELAGTPRQQSAAVAFEDRTSMPFPPGHLRSGAAILSLQSQCPFKAFATARLGADGWDIAEAGLTTKQRGLILHAVLRSVWSGRRPGIASHQDLTAIEDLTGFVRTHVKSGMRSGIPPGLRERMPEAYFELEQTRLIRLVTTWLEFERGRLPFTVEATETESLVTLAGLSLKLRPDRVDRLQDGSQLVIDYKTGNVDSRSWDLPRPENVQLPLYKLFGLVPIQPSLFDTYGGPASGGLVYARVRTGDIRFEGRVADAQSTISSELRGNNTLVSRKLTAAQEADWKTCIEQLAGDFEAGRSEIHPRDYPKTCKHCRLQSICRIQVEENRTRLERDLRENDDGGEE